MSAELPTGFDVARKVVGLIAENVESLESVDWVEIFGDDVHFALDILEIFDQSRGEETEVFAKTIKVINNQLSPGPSTS